MSIDVDSHKFSAPYRVVIKPADVGKWELSEAYQDILGFLTSMNESVKGKALSYACDQSDAVKSIVKVISTIDKWADEIPPIDQPSRYGNQAFRDFYAKLKNTGKQVLEDAIPEKYHKALDEISVYLIEGFGNATRIDYGTGHELAFIMFLTSLYKIGYLKKEDSIATVIKIFKSYLDLVRKLQTIYKMEPAGSQGVWSLDDYQFVPFIWGSSQLVMHPKIAPEMYVNEKIVEDYAHDYLFLGCIKFILTVKTGPFAEHSNQLWNISGVSSWTKVNSGLFKMYKNEILNKFPIIQHVLFGTILTINPADKMIFKPSDTASSSTKTPPQLVGSPVPHLAGPRAPGPILGIMNSGARLNLAAMNTGSIPRGTVPPDIMGVMPPRTGVPISGTGIMPPRIGIPPDVTGVMPPRTSMHPDIMNTITPKTSMLPDIMGVMPPQTRVQPDIVGVMPLSTGVSSDIVIPPKGGARPDIVTTVSSQSDLTICSMPPPTTKPPNLLTDVSPKPGIPINVKDSPKE